MTYDMETALLYLCADGLVYGCSLIYCNKYFGPQILLFVLPPSPLFYPNAKGMTQYWDCRDAEPMARWLYPGGMQPW